MRVITSDKIKCLSMRLDHIPGLWPATIVSLNKVMADTNIGIKKDRRVFLATAPVNPTALTKVWCIYYNTYVTVWGVYKCDGMVRGKDVYKNAWTPLTDKMHKWILLEDNEHDKYVTGFRKTDPNHRFGISRITNLKYLTHCKSLLLCCSNAKFVV